MKNVLMVWLVAASCVQAAEWPVLKTYEGEYLRRVKMPLGGVGTGTISLAGRGALVDWAIRGSSAVGFTPNVHDVATGFWIRTEDEDGRVVARLLEGPLDTELYDGEEGARTPNHGFPRFGSCRFKAAYPFAQVELSDRSVPVRATLEAMNPLVPGDAESSGIPAALFRWRLVNPSARPVRVTLLGFLVNPAGGVCAKTAFEEEGLAGISVGSADDAPTDTTLGQVALVVPRGSGETAVATRFADDGWTVRMDRVWKRFVASGRATEVLPEKDGTEMPAASLSIGFTLAPGETRRVPFVLGWRFPHRYGWTKKGYRSEIVMGPFAADHDLGNYYATRFASARAAAAELLRGLDGYEAKTRAFVADVLAAAAAPDVVKEAALFNLAVLRTETCFRTKDGHFFGWEGVFADGGSCYGNCTHVWGYEHALIDLWPELAKDMTELQFGPQMAENGGISFRVGLPLDKNAYAARPAADGQLQCIVKAYENWKKTGDDAWMKRLYPRIRRAMEFCWRAEGDLKWDANCDGVMEGRQHNTMDVDYYGPNPQMEFLYLAALKAMAALADAADDGPFADTCRALAEKGGVWTEKNLFNGAYYEHQVDGDRIWQLGAGCLVDQLVGDYAARHVGLGPVADESHALTTLRTILAKNASSNVGARYNCGRDYAFPEEPALKMAWYPEGRMPEKPFPYYGENMTGFEYVVAANLAQRGLLSEAERVVRDIRSRYDGRKRNPFDEAECGRHYVRSLVAWSVLKDWCRAND